MLFGSISTAALMLIVLLGPWKSAHICVSLESSGESRLKM